MADHTPNVLDPFSAPYASREERAEVAKGLRELATWIETTRFPIPITALYSLRSFDIHSTWIDDKGFVERIFSAVKLIGGKVKKGTLYASLPDSDFTLTREFAGDIKAIYVVNRAAVCEEQEVVKEVTKTVSKDEARAANIEAEIARLREEKGELGYKIKEFVCPPSLAVKEAAIQEGDDDLDLEAMPGRITYGDMVGGADELLFSPREGAS